MTTATVAPVSGNQLAVLLVLAGLAVLAICAVLYQHERIDDRHGTKINEHDQQLATLAYQMPALLDWLGVEIPAPVADDSPSAEESVNLNADTEVQALDAEPEPGDCPTDEIPIAPATVPDGIPLAVQSALIEQRPSPVPRGKSAEWVEEELERVRARIDAAREAS